MMNLTMCVSIGTGAVFHSKDIDNIAMFIGDNISQLVEESGYAHTALLLDETMVITGSLKQTKQIIDIVEKCLDSYKDEPRKFNQVTIDKRVNLSNVHETMKLKEYSAVIIPMANDRVYCHLTDRNGIESGADFNIQGDIMNHLAYNEIETVYYIWNENNNEEFMDSCATGFKFYVADDSETKVTNRIEALSSATLIFEFGLKATKWTDLTKR